MGNIKELTILAGTQLVIRVISLRLAWHGVWVAHGSAVGEPVGRY